MIKNRRFAFVQYGDVRRIVATEDISIPGRIEILKGEMGGIIDGNINVSGDVDIWINKTSKIEGDFSISSNLFMDGSELHNTTDEELSIATDTELIGSILTNVNIQRSSSMDSVNQISIVYSKLTDSYIIPGYSPEFKQYEPTCCHIRKSTISKSNIIGRFDIDHSCISESVVRNITIRSENMIFKKTNITEISKSKIWCDSDCDIVDLRRMKNSHIDLYYRHILNFASMNFDHLYMDSVTDFFYITNIGSRVDTTFFYKRKIDKHFEIFVSCGCFKGTIDEFEDAVEKTHKKGSRYRKQYHNAIKLARNIIEIK